MHRNDGNTQDAPTHAEASAGNYLIPEFHFRQLEGMRDDLILLAALAAHADPERPMDGLCMKTLASSAQRAGCALDSIVASARWQPKGR